MPDTESLLKKSQAMLDQTKAEGTKAFAGSSFDKPISTTDLIPETPAIVTPPTTPTQADGMLGEFQAGTDAFTSALTESRKEAEKNLQSSKDPYQDFLKSVRGESSLTSDAYSTKGGVDDIQSELNSINQQILSEQRGLQNRVRSIEERGGGLQGGVEAEVRNATRESLRTQADLSVIQMGVQGRYDSAKAIADRAVDAYLEDQKLELEALKFNYEENKDLFTQAEQREFDVMYQDRQRALDREEEDLKTISDLSVDALSNGAPSSIAAQMRSAKTVEEAMRIGGSYVGALARQSANRASANAALDRRMKLLELAEAGDTLAMEELGLDPNAPDVEKKVAAQNEVARIDSEITRVQGMLENVAGLETAAGAVRSPFISSIFGTTAERASQFGPLGVGAGMTEGALNYAKTRDAKAKFLADASYITANLTAEKVRQLKASGVAFTPMTDRDIQLIGESASTLNGYAIRDEANRIVGFTSEPGAVEALNQIKSIFENSRDTEYRKLLSPSEIAEIESQ